MQAADTAREMIPPGDDVPARRVEQRARIGIDGEPMIELDTAGAVVYVGGDWEALVGFTKPGPAALDALLDGVADGVDQVRHSIEAARLRHASAVWDHGSLPDLAFLKVLPIPSPTVADAMHVVVGLSASPTL